MLAGAALLGAALLVQNLAEWRGGGPTPPIRLARRLPRPPDQAMRRAALILVSLAVPVLLMLAASWPDHRWSAPVLMMLSGALAVNALAQAAASIFAGRMLPGTLSGLLLMLPAALWLIASAATPLSAPWRIAWSLAGALIAPFALWAIWRLAATITRADRHP